MTETAQKIYDMLPAIGNDVIKRGNIHTFLVITGHFPDLSFVNQLLLWKQMPEAGFVAPKKAFESNGGTIYDDASPIAFLFPDNNEDQISYKAVPVYDISDIKWIKIRKKEADMKDVFLYIRQKTHMPVVAGGKKMLGEELSRFDPEKELFIIRDAMTEKEKITLFITRYSRSEK